MRAYVQKAAIAVTMVAMPIVCEAQDQRGWVDVNFGVSIAAEDQFSTSDSFRLFQETATLGVDYFAPTGASFDFGAGYMFTPMVGVGVSFSGTAHEDTAVLHATIPHPTIFNRPASDAAETDGKLKRTEGGVHLQVMVVPVHSERVRVRLFGGPSYYRVRQDVIADFRYLQTFTIFAPTNTIDITTYQVEEQENEAWGFHVGGDVSYFFSRVVGVGGFARFGRATVELEDVASVFETKAGGFQTGGGLRLRF